MSSTRRSSRMRNATEEATADTPALSNHTHDENQVTTSPRKRKRSSRDHTNDSDISNGSNVTPTQDTQAALTTADGIIETSPSPAKRGPGRPRGRPAKGQTGSTIHQEQVAPVNGLAHRETRSTRSSQNVTEAIPAASSSSSLSLAQPIDIKHEDESSEHELWLDASHAATLSMALQQISPQLLNASFNDTSSSQIKARGRKKASSVTTLAGALDGRPITLRRLRAIVLALRRPLVGAASHNTQDSDDVDAAHKRQLTGMTIVLSLIDEIARSTRQKQYESGQITIPLGAAPVKKEDNTEALDDLLDGDDATGKASPKDDILPPRKYALHMRLPLGDYFTEAIELTPEQTRELDTGAADLVEVEPPPTFEQSSAQGSRHKPQSQVPTLGSRRFRQASLRRPAHTIEELREKRMGRVRPTTDLYFGPFASFAPSYDSSDANISRDTTALLWRTKMDPLVCASRKAWNKVREPVKHEENSVEEEEEEEEEAADSAEATPARTTARNLNLDPSLDADLIASFVDSAPSSAEIDSRLRDNADLLDKLQDYQWSRLQSGYARWKASTKQSPADRGRTRAPAIPEDEPSQQEQEVARQLLEGLSALVKMRPREKEADTRPTLLPNTKTLRALSHSVAIDPALSRGSEGGQNSTTPKGFWGTLDGSIYGPQPAMQLPSQAAAQQQQRNSRGAGRSGAVVVPSFESSTTARLDAKGENASHTRRIATAKTGLPPGVSGDIGGPGLLDRVMGVMGRQVSHQASISAGVRPPPPPPTQLDPGRLPPNVAPGAMSPPAASPSHPLKMMPPPMSTPGPGLAGAGAGGASSPSSSGTMNTRRSFPTPR